MLTLVARTYIHSSSQHFTRCLFFNYPLSSSSNTRQYHHNQNQSTQPQFSHYLINLQSWKLTHQPHEPTLHWNPRFRQHQQVETDEQVPSSDYWDSWFEQHQSPSLLPFSQRNNFISTDQVYFLDFPHSTSMPKRPRESSSSIDKSNKREKYSHCKFPFE